MKILIIILAIMTISLFAVVSYTGKVLEEIQMLEEENNRLIKKIKVMKSQNKNKKRNE